MFCCLFIGRTTWAFNKIFYRPNLSGTWSGILKSNWKNENGFPRFHDTCSGTNFPIVNWDAVWFLDLSSKGHSEANSIPQKLHLENIVWTWKTIRFVSTNGNWHITREIYIFLGDLKVSGCIIFEGRGVIGVPFTPVTSLIYEGNRYTATWDSFLGSIILIFFLF